MKICLPSRVGPGHPHYRWWALSCTSLGMLMATINSGSRGQRQHPQGGVHVVDKRVEGRVGEARGEPAGALVSLLRPEHVAEPAREERPAARSAVVEEAA